MILSVTVSVTVSGIVSVTDIATVIVTFVVTVSVTVIVPVVTTANVYVDCSPVQCGRRGERARGLLGVRCRCANVTASITFDTRGLWARAGPHHMTQSHLSRLLRYRFH